MLAILFLLFSYWVYLNTLSIFYYFLVFIFTPFFQFLITPAMTLLGIYTYLSPMLLVYNANDKVYDLHNGTSFDYLMVMTTNKGSLTFKRRMLQYYLEGLLSIIDKLEKEQVPLSLIIRGSSYFFSERTVKRLGFKIIPPKSTEKLNIWLNFIDLTWMYSLANNKFTIPRIDKLKSAEISGEALVKKKEAIKRLLEYISAKR